MLVTGPAHGTLTLNANGSFTYTPTANYNGADSFTYKANDGTADSNVATVSLTINAVNHAPVATVGFNTRAPQTNDVLTATATKSDPDGDPVSVTYVWKVNDTVKRTFTSATLLTDTFDLSVAGNGDRGDTVTVEVTPSDRTLSGTTVFDTATIVAGSVVGRHIFYNNSVFDGSNVAANTQDDKAIAPENSTDPHLSKSALLPGQRATFNNYTSYSKGINGIMVDFDYLPGMPTVSDFEFKVGNTLTPDSWAVAPAPQSITVRQVNGVQRVTIIWTDNAIQKQWLQVTVKTTANTGLTQNDVFYYGNAIGEVGNSTSNAIVNNTDEIETRNHRAFNPPATLENPYDFNRDKLVNVIDQIDRPGQQDVCSTP